MKNNKIIWIVVVLLLLLGICALFVNIYSFMELNNNAPRSEACPMCGSEDHLTHPVDKSCEVCGSPFHYTAEHETEQPTCPQCGSTAHTVHPSDGEL